MSYSPAHTESSPSNPEETNNQTYQSRVAALKSIWGIVQDAPKIEVDLTNAFHYPVFAQAIFGNKATKEPAKIMLQCRGSEQTGQILHEPLFSHGIYSIGLHGNISGADSMPLSPAAKKRVQDGADAEKLLHYIIQLTAGTRTPRAIRRAIGKAISFVREKCDYAAANIVFSNGRFLWGIREVNQYHELVKSQKLMNLFSLHYGVTKEARFLASEPSVISGCSWEKLPNHTLIEIDTKTQKTEVMKL